MWDKCRQNICQEAFSYYDHYLNLISLILSLRTELLQRELEIRQKEYLSRLAELEHEMEIAKQKAKLEQLRRDVHRASPPPRPPEAEMPVLMQPQMSPVDMDPLYPAPYDPK